jgi:5-(carboxyamino)imidazole ribonucleotide synthase
MNVGVLGGGQLGRMLALAGYPLGMRFRFLDPSPVAPVRRVAEQIVGAYDEPEVLKRFADGLDVATYEFENVPVETVRRLAAVVPVYPPPRALEIAQDRLCEKAFFAELGVATASFAKVDTRTDLETAISRIGLPAVLKTRRMGYDGKGQTVLRGAADVEPAWQSMQGTGLILEGFVGFARELSVIAVRGRYGALAYYPLVENQHRDGILRVSIAPAPRSHGALYAQAEAIARAALKALDYVGVLAIELFEVDGRLLVNEIAPRVHNSGHWTIEGAQTSQFANHLRAIAGLPLGSTAVRGQAAMINLIGTLPDAAEILKIDGAYIHLYDKEPRPGRKLGHVTVLAEGGASDD